MPVHQLGQLLHRPQVVPAARLLHRRLRRLRLRLAQRPAVLPQEVVDVEPRVPDVDVRLRREVADRRPVGLRDVRRDLATLLVARADAARGDLDARQQPLHVPLERARKGLVEVVEVEEQPALGRAVQAEVRHVRVTAQLHVEPGVRGRREVGGHEQRRAAVERERRRRHPPVPQREQLGHPGQCPGTTSRSTGRGASSSARRPRGSRAGAAPARPPLGPRARCGSGGGPGPAARRRVGVSGGAGRDGSGIQHRRGPCTAVIRHPLNLGSSGVPGKGASGSAFPLPPGRRPRPATRR